MSVSKLRYRIGTMRRERARARFYRQFVRPGDLAFDVGAHVGDRTAVLLRAGAAQVVAVEPHPALQDKLRRAFTAQPRVTLVPEALGPAPGEAELRWPDGGLPLASMSDTWIEHVRGSGRFGGDWSNVATVRVTTLDALVDRYGLPAFCKIDVEGFEDSVLQGLSSPIPTISIEFTPEHLDSVERSLTHLGDLGDYRFNFGLGERLKLLERRWMHADELLARLRHIDPQSFGDVYARLDD